VVAQALSKLSAKATASFFADRVVQLWGACTVHTDGGSEFTGAEAIAAFTQRGGKHHVGSAYNPESQGAVEARWRPLKKILRTSAGREASRWDDHLAVAVYLLNNTPNSRTGISPQRALMGLPVKGALELLTGGAASTWVTDTPCGDLAYLLRELVRGIMERLLGKKDQEGAYEELEPGTKALLYTPATNKWESPWRTFVEVIEQLDVHHVKVRHLNLGHDMVVHRRRLRRYDASRTTLTDMLERQLGDGWYIVEAVVGHRKRDDGEVELEIKWQDNDGETSWEPLSNLKRIEVVREYCAANKLDGEARISARARGKAARGGAG
jgi:hypothetical protein